LKLRNRSARIRRGYQPDAQHHLGIRLELSAGDVPMLTKRHHV
jgi:hypothetical protein